MQQSIQCWCGNAVLAPFSMEYAYCQECHTLVSQAGLSPEETLVKDDNNDFYGKEYWLSHQPKDLDQPDIYQRARSDLTERCLHWIRTIFKFKLPPANLLELGCAHGGFVALLRQAGYEATGLELSPWVAEFARTTFNVPTLIGPIEEQEIQPGSLDIIVLMDVLEHLPHPTVTMRRCIDLLKPDGILVIQTPCYPVGKSHPEMAEQNNPFLTMLQADEHLYLFSQASVQRFFQQLGCPYIQFEPAIFANYDMFIIVSRSELQPNTETQVTEFLASKPNTRVIQALLDLADQRDKMTMLYQEAETNSTARLAAINTLTTQIENNESFLKKAVKTLIKNN